jgi:UPF0716 family protein affecting phage T7 exclusion
MRAWLLTITVPLMVYFVGARSFIEVMSVVGAIVFGSTGIMICLTYLKAKKDAWLPKRHFHYSAWPLYACSLVLLAGIITTVIGMF